jgi:hypothetical protein
MTLMPEPTVLVGCPLAWAFAFENQSFTLAVTSDDAAGEG